jgi:hypothetical protein
MNDVIKPEGTQDPAQETPERLLAPPQSEPDGLMFGWEFPALSNPTCWTFQVEVRRQEERSKFRFSLDLAKLQAAGRATDLGRIQEILALRHAGLDDRHSLLRALEWMLVLSAEQILPELSLTERQARARRLLLLPKPAPSPEQNA